MSDGVFAPTNGRADVNVTRLSFDSPGPPLVIVTDPAVSDDRWVAIVESLEPGIPFAVLVRDRARPREAVAKLAHRMRVGSAARGAALIVHTDLDLAESLGADAVHLSSQAVASTEAESWVRRAHGLGALVTFAAHSEDELRRGRDIGGDVALVSPIFEVPGKGPARGPRALQEARRACPTPYPLVALGGIAGAEHARICAGAGASSVAVSRALGLARDPGATARSLLDALKACR